MPQCAASTLDMLERSRASLLEACRAHDVPERYLHAQLGALRAGAALLAARSGAVPAAAGRRQRGGGRPQAQTGSHADGIRATSRPGDLWRLVAAVAPEVGEWADFFAVSTARRAPIAQGRATVTTREADDLLRQAETFVDLVAVMLGLPRHAGHGDLLLPTGRA